MIQQRLWGIGLLGFIMVLSANSVSHGQDTPYVPYIEVWHLSEEFALDAVWKPDGTSAAYLSNLGIHIFDAQYNEQQVIELPLLVEWFYAALEWSSDGNYLAVTGFGENGQNTLSVWEVASGQPIFTYPVNRVYDMAWRPHSTQISLVTDVDNMNGPTGNILLIDITSGDITRLTESARSLRWDETGTTLYAGSYRDNTFAYNLLDGNHTLLSPEEADRLSLQDYFIYNPDGTLRATFMGIQDVNTLEYILEYEEGEAQHQRWHPTGNMVLMQGMDFVAVWDITTNSSVMLFDRAPLRLGNWASYGNTPFMNLAWSADGTQIARSKVDLDGLSVGIWDIETRTLVQQLQADTGIRSIGSRYNWISWNHASNRLAAAETLEGPIAVWDVESGEVIWQTAISFNWVALSPDGNWLAVPSRDGISLINIEDGSRMLLEDSYWLLSSYSGAFSTEGERFAIATGHDFSYVFMWDTQTGELVELVAGYGIVAIHEDRFATVFGNTLQIRDMVTGDPILTIREAGRESLAWHPDGSRIAILGEAGINIYNTQTGDLLQSLNTADWINAVAFSPDGTRLAASTAGYGVVIWEQVQP